MSKLKTLLDDSLFPLLSSARALLHGIALVGVGAALLACAAYAQVPSVTPPKTAAPVPAAPAKAVPDWVQAAQKKKPTPPTLQMRAAELPAGFEQNMGQFEGDANFIGRSDAGVVLLRPRAITTVIAPRETIEVPAPRRR